LTQDAAFARDEGRLEGFVERMLKTGYTGSWGIEVLSQDLRKLSLNKAATQAPH
jgi:hypothetical protein